MGLPEAARRAALAVSGRFQKTAGFVLKEKERKRVAAKLGIWLNLHRYMGM